MFHLLKLQLEHQDVMRRLPDILVFNVNIGELRVFSKLNFTGENSEPNPFKKVLCINFKRTLT